MIKKPTKHPNPPPPGLAGFALTSALNLTGTLAWMVRQTTELEVNMNSGEGVGVSYDLGSRRLPASLPVRVCHASRRRLSTLVVPPPFHP
jgi:hypothetical protein